MNNKVPFTAFCPECQAGRTFTVLGSGAGSGLEGGHTYVRVGCCVCGTLERDALIALSSRVTDDRESLGEISARLNTLDGEVEELREELLTTRNDLSQRISAEFGKNVSLARKIESIQSRLLFRVVAEDA